MDQKMTSIALGNFVKTRILKYEAFLILAIALCLLLVFLDIPFHGIITVLVLSSIAVVYFFSAFAPDSDPEATGWENFIGKLTGFTSAVLLIGILYKIQHWPGSEIMIILGMTTMGFTVVFTLIRWLRKPEQSSNLKWLFFRQVMLIIIGLLLTFGKVTL
ncbi:MAG: hypothetical protein U0T82_16335 [Bacteroidales bacterium]